MSSVYLNFTLCKMGLEDFRRCRTAPLELLPSLGSLCGRRTWGMLDSQDLRAGRTTATVHSQHTWWSQYPESNGSPKGTGRGSGKARRGPDDVRGPEVKNGKLGGQVFKEEVAGTGEGIAFSLPLPAVRAAGTHMFWCMRQPSAPVRLPPQRLRRTDTLLSLLPARLPPCANSQ